MRAEWIASAGIVAIYLIAIKSLELGIDLREIKKKFEKIKRKINVKRRLRRMGGTTDIKIRTAIDGCGEGCKNFEIIKRTTIYPVEFVCARLDVCLSLKEVLEARMCGEELGQ